MPKLVRSLLLWLLALALPLQGLAAPLMLHCAPVVALETHPSHAAPESHEPHASHQTSHSAATHGGALAPDTDAASADHRCSACAACCAALALPATLRQPAPPGPEPVQRPSSAAPVAPYLTDGLERPPRASLD